jgi:two-component system, NarL family, response regulator LiaR
MAKKTVKHIRILVADDHTLVREGLCGLLATVPDFQVVGQAADGVEATELALTHKPDVLLLDLMMPRRSGLEALQAIHQVQPEIRVLILTSFGDEEQVFAAIKAGALGYLLKDAASQELIQSIREVYSGRLSLSPAMARKLMREMTQPAPAAGPEELTEREAEVLQQLAQGLSNREIGQRLGISEWTVRTHVSHILEKLHVANRTQAALHARKPDA